MPTPLITHLTDFGDPDGGPGAYVGMLQGVLLRHCPEARLVDLGHRAGARPIFDAAWLLRRVHSYYPAGTVHLAGIDNGGGLRRVLAASAGGQYYLGADNGVLSLVLQQTPGRVYACALAAPTPFLARDVLAPLAGRLARGEDPANWALPVDDWLRLELSAPRPVPEGWRGEVLAVDPFGNLLTNFTPAHLAAAQGVLDIAGQQIALWRADYSEARPGELFLYWGAEGWLEVALAQASAATALRAGTGTEVVLR